MILAPSRATHESVVLSKTPACIHGISGYTHPRHGEHDTSCTATEGEASARPIIFLRCQVINTTMLVVFWRSSWMITTSGEVVLGNSPNKETREKNVPVFDNTVPYHIPSEITGHFCNLIGSQQCDSLEVSVLYICYDVTFSNIKNRIRCRGKTKHTCTQLAYGNFFKRCSLLELQEKRQIYGSAKKSVDKCKSTALFTPARKS